MVCFNQILKSALPKLKKSLTIEMQKLMPLTKTPLQKLAHSLPRTIKELKLCSVNAQLKSTLLHARKKLSWLRLLKSAI